MKKYIHHNLYGFRFKERTWPDKKLTKAPIWCSVDLRDGNQALINPMTIEKKIKLFKALVAMGFKEIEVGFPAASETEYSFTRTLIEQKMIPDDVTIQVLTQARKDLIEKTMQSIIGAKKVIVHLYNSTSIAQRKMVFQKKKKEIIDIALAGVDYIKENITKEHAEITLQYSPESFTGTEIDFSLKICEQVFERWNQGRKRAEKVIINLPATVELFGPHIFADLIEYFHTKVKHRKKIILSVHTHNDRGTGIAASELALLAGAERVEGTLFGNGERTGNVDLVTLALNLFTHGVNPKLKLDNIEELIEISDYCTELGVPKRHPYAGELVFTAFSGSHQDAIKKGFDYRKSNLDEAWQVPYLSIDPKDIGRTYQAIIRINSQSGKGGTAYIMEKNFGFILPRELQVEFTKVVQKKTDRLSREITPQEMKELFDELYLGSEKVDSKNSELIFKQMRPTYLEDNQVKVELKVRYQGKDRSLIGQGNGPVDASKEALLSLVKPFKVLDFSQHSLSKGSNAEAICYVKLGRGSGRTIKTHYGVGIDANITTASIKAVISGINLL